LDKIPEYEEGLNGSNGKDDKEDKDEKDKKNEESEKDGKDVNNEENEKDANKRENGKKVNIVKDNNNSDGNKEEDDSLEKPAFGSNDDHGEGGGSKIGGKQTNPQKGDYWSIISYGLILICSSLFLILLMKRRFV